MDDAAVSWIVSTNLTAAPLPPSSPTAFTLACCALMALTAALGAGLNALVLLAFLRNRALLGPFTLHVLHLCVFNLILILAVTPLALRHHLLGAWDLGRGWCVYYLYGVWALYSLPIIQHLLMAYDRVCAVCCPLLYRKTKSIKLVLLLSVLAVGYAHFWALPLVLLDGGRRAARNECFVDVYAWPVHTVTVQLMLYALPILATYTAFPLVVVKLWRNRLKRMNICGPSEITEDYRTSSDESCNCSLGGRRPSRLSSLVQCHGGPPSRRASLAPSFLQFLKRDPKMYLFLLLVSAEMLFWGPKLAYYLLINDPAYYDPRILLAVTANYGMLYCTDPVIYMLCLDGLRKEVFSILTCRKRPAWI